MTTARRIPRPGMLLPTPQRLASAWISFEIDLEKNHSNGKMIMCYVIEYS